MPQVPTWCVRWSLFAVLLATGAATSAQNLPLPRGTPEDVGLSSERLNRIATVLRADVEKGRLPGAVVAIARHGKIVYFEAIGYRDKAAGAPMTTDAIFNIALMTKPVTAVAGLQLLEQGQLLMGDSVGTYFPALAKPQVAVMDPAGERILSTVPANRPIAVLDLFRHTSGIIYGDRGRTAVHTLYPGGSGGAAELTGDEFVARLGTLPLLYQPGSTWDYGFGLDILGLVVEKLSHRTLGQYFQEQIFQPLGMVDTAFVVPESKVSRFARALPKDPDTGAPQNVTPRTTPAKFECGGGCLTSTAGDYLRFALMLRNKGQLGTARILAPKTVEYMLSNQLGPEVRNLVGNADPTRADYGFGLGLAVRTTPGIVKLLGSVGDFSWPGASGTNWWVDPQEDLTVVFMAHTPGAMRWHYRQVVNALVYQAIVK